MGAIQIMQNIQFIIPVEQVGILVLLIVGSIALGRFRIGLAITLFFLLYWVFIYNKEAFASTLGDSPTQMTIYFISGGIVFLLALFLFLIHSLDRD